MSVHDVGDLREKGTQFDEGNILSNWWHTVDLRNVTLNLVWYEQEKSCVHHKHVHK